MRDILKKESKHFIALFLFIILVVIYFSPSIIDGKVLQQGDSIKYQGMVQELQEYYDEEGKTSEWVGSMFSGMPAYQIGMLGTAPSPLYRLTQSFKFLDYMGGSIVLAGLIAFYLLMCVMGVNRWLAIAGAIAYAFGSYNFIILIAGHISKAYVIAYMPLTIAGMFLLFKRKLLWGTLLFILGVALSIMEGHLQITYYLALFCLFIYFGYFYREIKDKKYKQLLLVSGVMAISVLIAVAPNAANLYSNYEMSKTSLRGTSELSSVSEDSLKKPSGGLDRDYAFQWSYGKAELLTMLIPNIYGGSSRGSLDSSSEFYKILKANGYQVGSEVQAPTYWGDKIFTEGPVYFGALVCFLFVLGMFVIKNKMKWWLFAGALFFVFLSLGRNMAWFNDFLFYHLPMYNKFRTPEMALVIPGLVFPIIAFWGLNEVIIQKVDTVFLKKALLWALGLTGGICLLVWLFPTLFFSFQSAYDGQYTQQLWYSGLVADRASLASSDAFRSLLFILIGAGLIFLFLKAKDKGKIGTIVCFGIAILVLSDLWSVDKRYLNNDNFANEKLQDAFKPSVANLEILKDNDVSFRVINLNNPFEETYTSFFHRSVGGYHAAKLLRYQELISHRLLGEVNTIIQSFQKENLSMMDIQRSFLQTPSLNMLNTRYVIYNPGQPPIVNPFAYGDVWFVSTIEMVENADAEIAALDRIDPLTTAVVDRRFADHLSGFIDQPDSTAMIRMESYRPNQLEYISESTFEQVAVFSEIYYQPGWKAYLDGEQVPHFRADWTLRAMRIPAGKHQIEFRFEPDAYHKAKGIGIAGSWLIVLLLLGGMSYSVWQWSWKEKQDSIKN